MGVGWGVGDPSLVTQRGMDPGWTFLRSRSSKPVSDDVPVFRSTQGQCMPFPPTSLQANYQTLPPETVLGWIEKVTGQRIANKKDVQGSLKDGRLLCQLVNKIKPGSVRRIGQGNLPYMQMDNISQFIRAAKAMGMKQQDCMSAVDLFDGSNIPQVLICLEALGRCAQEVPGFRGPHIGARQAQTNRRNPGRRTRPGPALTLLESKAQDVARRADDPGFW